MSNLIKDTTMEERIALIKQWVQAASFETYVGLQMMADSRQEAIALTGLMSRFSTN